jgi:hypothetical protein
MSKESASEVHYIGESNLFSKTYFGPVGQLRWDNGWTF